MKATRALLTIAPCLLAMGHTHAATASVDLRKYFPAPVTNTYRNQHGDLAAVFNFFVAARTDDFGHLYTTLFDLQRPGTQIVWQKSYPTPGSATANCTLDYGNLFLDANDKAVTEVGDWLNDQAAFVGPNKDQCPNAYRALGYQNGTTFALPATGLAWSGPNGLDGDYQTMQTGRVYGQVPPLQNYNWANSGKATEYSRPGLVGLFASWTPGWGRVGSAWGMANTSYSNVARVVLFHGVGPVSGTNEHTCTGLDPSNPYSAYYWHTPGYNSYAIELYLDTTHGILEQTVLFDETAYFTKLPCDASLPTLSSQANLGTALQTWQMYLDR